MMPNFLTSPDLRTEPARSRVNLLVCALCVSSLALASTVAHTERRVAVAIQREQAQAGRVASRSIRTAQTATGELVSRLGRLMGRRSR